jgi:hypothetical protein
MQLQLNMKSGIELEHANKPAHIFLDKSTWNLKEKEGDLIGVQG